MLGYTGEQPRMQMLQNTNFVDAKVEIYLKQGSRVSFEIQQGPKGQLAQNIQAQPGPIQTQPAGPAVERPPRQPKVRAPQFHAAGGHGGGEHANK